MTDTDTVTVTAGTEGIAIGQLTITLNGLNPPNIGTGSVNLISSISSQTTTTGDI